jgi:hypothetical protein
MGGAPSGGVALRLSPRHVTGALVVLWLVAAIATAALLTQPGHAMQPSHWAPVAILTAVLAAWPFALGWRPWTPRARRLRTCGACGTQWRPSDEGTARCPACGAP